MNREHKRIGAVCVIRSNPCRFVPFQSWFGTDQEERRLSDSSMLLLKCGISQPLLYGIGRFLDGNLQQWTTNTNVWMRCAAYRTFPDVDSVSIAAVTGPKRRIKIDILLPLSPSLDFSAPSLWNWIILRWKFTSVNREHKRVGAVRCVLYVLPCRFRFDSGVGQDQKEEAKFISSSHNNTYLYIPTL